MAYHHLILVRGAGIIFWLLISQTPSTWTCVHARIPGGSCISSDRDALLSFKASLLDPAGRLSSWQGLDCCQWKGVGCNNRTGHVVKLNLGGNAYSDDYWYEKTLSLSKGEMSSSLVALQHLMYLDLSWNDFSGTSIPVSIGSLKNLRHLNLSFAGFIGRIPSQLGNLSNLQYLDVSGNEFFSWEQKLDYYLSSADLSWLQRLSLLRNLDMSSVDLSTARGWVHSVNMLHNLKVLRLSSCGLNSTASNPPLSNLTNLEVLDLSFNQLSTALQHNWFLNLTGIKELYLAGYEWNGPIPDALGNVSSLQVLDLSGSSIVGLRSNTLKNLCNLQVFVLVGSPLNTDIGEFIQRLPTCSWNTLQVLNLYIANLTGKLPISVCNMTNLRVLQASGNMLNGPLPVGIGALLNLEILGLGNNNFSGPVPLGIGSLRKLKTLDLSYNRLDGVIFKEHLELLTHLDYLDLSYNSLKLTMQKNWVPPFKLKVAGFRSCQLGPGFPLWLRSQTDMDVLIIENANLDDVLPDWFWVTFSHASFLQASRNKLRGTLPANLQHMSADHMYLGSNMFTGSIPQLPIHISHLNLSSNSLSGSWPTDFKAPFLEELLLANNQITGSIPSSICKLTGLKRLDLSGNKLTGDLDQMHCWKESYDTSSMANTGSSDQFGSNMLSLALNNNDFTGEFPPFLQGAPKLLFLDLSHNSFYGSLPKWLPTKMPKLQILSLRSNMFSGIIPKNISDLANLHFLDIAHNNISGAIPESLENFKAMTVIIQNYEDYIFEESIPVITKDQQRDYTFEIYNQVVNLDFSCNSLTGHIPEEIHLLIGLTNLNLSSNKFSGTIPNQIGDLLQLESIDLSYNEFSGEIPPSLSALTSLSHLNLSYNNLSGTIPSGSQLQVLGNQNYIYIGNPGLCGPPLSSNCSVNETKQNVHEDRNHVEFLYLGMGIGFVIGLWTVFCTMLMKRTWMTVYFRFIDKLYDKFYVKVVISWFRLMKTNQDDGA